MHSDSRAEEHLKEELEAATVVIIELKEKFPEVKDYLIQKVKRWGEHPIFKLEDALKMDSDEEQIKILGKALLEYDQIMRCPCISGHTSCPKCKCKAKHKELINKLEEAK